MFDETFAQTPSGTGDVKKLYAGDGLSELENMMASGEMLPAQMPLQIEWSPCKKLAASVLASALVEIRDHSHDPSYKKRIAEDLEWIECGEVDWPFSFLRICDLLHFDPEWVVENVHRWLAVPPRERKKPLTPYRHAA